MHLHGYTIEYGLFVLLCPPCDSSQAFSHFAGISEGPKVYEAIGEDTLKESKLNATTKRQRSAKCICAFLTLSA
jgi:hypothetical protein